MSTPRTFVPSERVKLASLWVGWPYLLEEWGSELEGARREIVSLVRQARRFVPVTLVCGSDDAEASARERLVGVDVQFVRIPAGDIWLRDTGPIVAARYDEAVALTFRFNGWGEKYIMAGDQQTASAMANHLMLPVIPHTFVLEGGAVEFDGAGRCLTTRRCLLNANRNLAWTENVAEEELKRVFGLTDVIWLDDGLKNDHTDGHVDNIARFIEPGRVICQRPSGPDDPNAERLARIVSELKAASLEVTTIPSPGRVVGADGSLPASHLNFVFVAGGVIVPIYEDVFSAQAAIELSEIFPDREIIVLPSRHILSGGGSFHCMTREIPLYPFVEA